MAEYTWNTMSNLRQGPKSQTEQVLRREYLCQMYTSTGWRGDADDERDSDADSSQKGW